MANDVAGPDDMVQRKQSTPSRARGKAGYRRLEAVLEAANIVVQRVETENDVGRDAYVDIVDGTDVTGGVICVQVKSGPSFYHQSQWMIPGRPADFTLWRESTVPVFGVVHDPDTDSLRWVDLSQGAQMGFDGYLSPIVTGPFGKKSVPVPDNNRLDLDVRPFISAAKTALRRRSGSHATALLSDDVETVETGIADTFAVGRHDATAFLLLAALFQRLPKDTRIFAASTLGMATSHPDVLWTPHNWIPETVKAGLRQRLRWTESDIVALLTEVDEEGIQRGTIGQTIYHVIAVDQDSKESLSGVALNRTVTGGVRLWAAAILLYQAGEDAQAALEHLLSSDASFESDEALFPGRLRLHEVDGFEYLAQAVADFGYVDLF